MLGDMSNAAITHTVTLTFEIREHVSGRHGDRAAVLFVNGRKIENAIGGSVTPRGETSAAPSLSKLRAHVLEEYPWVVFPRGAAIGATWAQTLTLPVWSVWGFDTELAAVGDHTHDNHHCYLVSLPSADEDQGFTHDIEIAAAAVA